MCFGPKSNINTSDNHPVSACLNPCGSVSGVAEVVVAFGGVDGFDQADVSLGIFDGSLLSGTHPVLLAKACSIGLRSNWQVGRQSRRPVRARSAADLWLPRFLDDDVAGFEVERTAVRRRGSIRR